MRNELNNIEKIERYLRNAMSVDERATFEKELSTNKDLQNEVKLQQDVLKTLNNIALKAKAKKAYKKYSIGKNTFKWGGIAAGTIILFAASYLTFKAISGNKTNTAEVTYELPELNENGEKIWADADKYLPYQKFTINAQQDTVLETEDGIVMAVPANCFLDENGKPVQGEIKLEVKEAIQSNDIMRAGLNTRSGNQLLETGGMFYINARKDDKSLTIDPKKGVYTEIPTNEIKDGMQVYEGKRLADGSIDWIKPKALEKFLIPVDINTLNFYPPNYEDTLASLGKDVRNKLYKDSLYYSFARLFDKSDLWKQINLLEIEEPKKDYKDTVNTVTNNPVINSNVNKNTQNNKILNADTSWMSFPYKLSTSQFNLYTQSGYKVSFSYKPDGSPYTIVERPNFLSGKVDTTKNDSTGYFLGINPAKIKAIWNNKFNNTILATKEFEERLQYIHTTCNSAILDLYVNNLDKKLCTIDSIAISLGGEKFASFASRNDGRIKGGEKHIEKLRKYYAQKTKAFTEAASKTENEFWKKHDDETGKALDAKANFNQKDFKNLRNNFVQEFDMNLKDAYRQLGYEQVRSIPKFTYTIVVTIPGWKNVDVAVMESTMNRTTLNYTDIFSGKTAVIKYEEITVSVKNTNEYDRVFAYLIPSKLDSYMRMPKTANGFSEKLNELMDHQLVVIAYKGQQPYYNLVGEVKPGNYNSISLAEIESSKLDNVLNKLKGSSQKQKLIDELAFRFVENKEAARQKKVKSIVEFRERIQRVVFPCSANGDTVLIPSADKKGYYWGIK